MENKTKQIQESGNNSINLQYSSGGISYRDARDIALDVFKDNFLKLARDASNLAKQRAEELVNSFLTRLFNERPDAISLMKNPDMQIAIYTAQKEYARIGDKNLEGLLVNMLVERAMYKGEDEERIFIDECINIVSKLTIDQLDALTLNFLIIHTKDESLKTIADFADLINFYIMPFLKETSINQSCFGHLEYAGCGSIMRVAKYWSIEEIFNYHYPHLFHKCFSKEDFVKEVGEINEYSSIINGCAHCDINHVILIHYLDKFFKNYTYECAKNKKLCNFLDLIKMGDIEVREFILNIIPETNKLFNIWDDSEIARFDLTPVGIKMAQVNYKRKTGKTIRAHSIAIPKRVDLPKT